MKKRCKNANQILTKYGYGKKPEKHYKMYGNTNKNAGSQAILSQWHKGYLNPKTASIYESRISQLTWYT